MVKSKKINSFFKRKISDKEESSIALHEKNNPENAPTSKCEEQPSKILKVTSNEFDIASLVRDPGQQLQIWQYPVNQRDEVRMAYLKWGLYQHKLASYPFIGDKNPRRFIYNWFSIFPSWLEYSSTTNSAYCLPCFLFTPKSNGRSRSDTFTVKGFQSWKKVNDGKNCAFLNHIGEDPNSLHKKTVKSCEDLLNQSEHISNIINVQSSNQIMKNRLRLKTSIATARWLTFQACDFRGHDEILESTNRGNFLEMIKLLSLFNEVENVVLENAPYNSKYTSHTIQKETLHILSSKIRNHIRKEIGDSKFCIIVDESCDESQREQMTLVLRFVDKSGLIQEIFFDLVHVKDTTILNLKRELRAIFFRHGLDVCYICGQGYDGASNMRGEWNGFEALFLKDCPYAYYVHCYGYRLQLVLVAVSRKVFPVHLFFNHLILIVNIICSSSKQRDELQAAKLDEIEYLLEIGGLVSGKGENQIDTLKWPGDTHWSSHFNSICSMINIFGATCSVLLKIIVDGSTYSQRAEADGAYNSLISFEFIFILHFMKEIMGVTNILCQALQEQSQDIVNAMNLVHTTKVLTQKLRDDGWQDLLKNVILFCEQHEIDVPDFNTPLQKGRSRQQKEHITLEHHYRVEIVLATTDKQLLELNNRFNDKVLKFLTLSSHLVPKGAYKAFNIENIYTLVKKYYPDDFTEQEKIILKSQLQHFIIDASIHLSLKNLSTIPELCCALVEIEKFKVYYLIDRLIRFILTLPVTTATTERSFSAMKIIKTMLRNKVEDDFLADNLVIHIEREIAASFTFDSIIDNFKSLKNRRAPL